MKIMRTGRAFCLLFKLLYLIKCKYFWEESYRKPLGHPNLNMKFSNYLQRRGLDVGERQERALPLGLRIGKGTGWWDQERILKIGLRAFILAGTVPEDWDYICEVSQGRKVPPLVQLWGYPQDGNREDCWDYGEAITPAAVPGWLSGAGSEQNDSSY